MKVSLLGAGLGAFGLGLAACSSSTTTQPSPTADCTQATPTVLAVGAYSVIDPTLTGNCLRLPAAGPGGAEYLVVTLASGSQETPNGVSGSYSLLGGTDTLPPAPPAPRLGAFSPPATAARFHAMLRQREAALAREPFARLPAIRPSQAAVPPMVGDKRTFKVCANTNCNSFVNVLATAKFVGQKGAIFLDDTVPAGGYNQADLDSVGTLFDTDLYPIDTTAFGSPSDLDNNGVVIVLLTDQINRLSGTCAGGSIILGYFFGLDLINDPNSNDGEVFYSIVPDPSAPTCTVSKATAKAFLAPTFIHEFQHMISFNRHVLLPPVVSNAEDTWLNEGLSHFAEELGGRLVPNAACVANDCLTQFAEGDLSNADSYLSDPESHFLIEPGNSTGDLDERGANWLFVRWFADRSPTDSMLGTDVTRALDGADNPNGTVLLGAPNVVAVAQSLFQPTAAFDQLLGQWQMANYLEGVSNFTEATGRLRYKSWDLTAAFNQLGLGPYPLVPDIANGSYSQQGTLRGGSGHHVRVLQPPSAPAFALGLTTSNTASVQPRLAVVRVR